MDQIDLGNARFSDIWCKNDGSVYVFYILNSSLAKSIYKKTGITPYDACGNINYDFSCAEVMVEVTGDNKIAGSFIRPVYEFFDYGMDNGEVTDIPLDYNIGALKDDAINRAIEGRYSRKGNENG